MITITPVSKSNKNLEVVMYKASVYCVISSLVLSQHSPLLNPSINCFTVVNHFDYFSQFSNCNISGACVIHSVYPSNQQHPFEESWICPCNLITEQLCQIYLKEVVISLFGISKSNENKTFECFVKQFKLVLGFLQRLLTK